MMGLQPAGVAWPDYSTSVRYDVLGLIFALALHTPLFFIKMDPKKKVVDSPASRLVAVDLMDEAALKKAQEAPPPPPIAEKQDNLMSKLKALVRREPPPPPVPKPEAAKAPDLTPKTIDLAPKADLPAPAAPKLQSKSGFETTANPALVQEKKLAMMGAAPAPVALSAQKLGTIENRDAVKSDKGKFQISNKDVIGAIGGGSARIADPAAPTIAIPTGKGDSKERFSAPSAAMADRGKFGGTGPAGALGGPDQKMGLRDSIIARDAAPSQISMSPRSAGADLAGALGATKQDAGRYQGGSASGGSSGGLAQPAAKAKAPALPVAAPVVKKKPSMFVIQGELQNRRILRQVPPEYPAWAQAQGIEASVVLEFTVTPDGSVKNTVVVRRTSGYPKLDQSAITALLQWQFAPLAGDENRQEVGLITFNYSLR